MFKPPTLLRFLLPVLVAMATVDHVYAEAPQVLSGGFNYMCSLTATEGSVRCWGAKTQSGVPTNAAASSLPYPAVNVSGVVSLAGGGSSVCALRNDGFVLCWGDNLYGAVGDAAVGSRTFLTPQIVNGVGSAIAIGSGAFSDHACAITAGFAAKCWGRGGSGQLGNGKFINTNVPQDVAGLGAVGAVATGTDHSCAIGLDGGVKCWGFGGLIGDGTGSSRPAATQVSGLTSGVVQLGAGFQHTCALLAAGTVKCWGSATRGQLGHGAVTGGASPVDVLNVTGAVQIALGRDYSCALLSTGSVRCWGSRQQALGDGIEWTSSNIDTPNAVTVVGLTGPAIAIGAGHNYACAVVATGAVECWGRDPNSKLSSAQEARASAHLGDYAIDTRLIMAEYRHGSLDYFFQTSRFTEKLLFKGAVPEFQPTGKSFMVFPTAFTANTKPITRYYFDKVAKGGLRGSHFYTLVDSERALLDNANPSNAPTAKLPQREGSDSFAYTSALEGVGGSCAAGQVPVYRAFRGAKFMDDANHRFTSDLALYSALTASGWDGEGVKFCVSTP